MRKPSAESIINTYRSMVDERASVPIGERVFTGETGISSYHWMGGFWRSWSAFQQAAGYLPNDPTRKIPFSVKGARTVSRSASVLFAPADLYTFFAQASATNSAAQTRRVDALGNWPFGCLKSRIRFMSLRRMTLRVSKSIGTVALQRSGKVASGSRSAQMT